MRDLDTNEVTTLSMYTAVFLAEIAGILLGAYLVIDQNIQKNKHIVIFSDSRAALTAQLWYVHNYSVSGLRVSSSIGKGITKQQPRSSVHDIVPSKEPFCGLEPAVSSVPFLTGILSMKLAETLRSYGKKRKAAEKLKTSYMPY